MPYIAIKTLIPNTTMKKYVNDGGTDMFYEITPAEGYETHNNVRNYYIEDFETKEKTYIRKYSSAACTVPIDYDFDNTKEIDGYTAYGEKEIFARKVVSDAGI